jgi:hypothetical protein
VGKKSFGPDMVVVDSNQTPDQEVETSEVDSLEEDRSLVSNP